MTNQQKKWEILSKGKVEDKDIIDVLLKNRGIETEKEKKEFFSPANPLDISLKSLGISKSEVKKGIERIKKAQKSGEDVIVYGDYDADGITGTATMWETLHAIGLNVLPHIPERFSEGYGLNVESVKKLKEKLPNLGLIITVDHGIVAGKKVKEVHELGIDMIITDHHQKGKEETKPLALIYTTQIGGSALSWIFAREIVKEIKTEKFNIENCLELAAIGTIADQLPLIGSNRSIVKYGLEMLGRTKRLGLIALFEDAGIEVGMTPRSVYEVGFIIAPRINSMGRLKHGLESLRLLCTKDKIRAREIAKTVGSTNTERQRVVEEVIIHARNSYKDIENQSVIILSDESYHEGVIGLAAAKLVEEFYKPAIVLSVKGGIAKASARSISGFNIIEAIRKLDDLYIEGGGHPMAAGFSIEITKIKEFTVRINEFAKSELTDEILARKLKVDMELDFNQLSYELLENLNQFEPTGLGNPGPTFITKDVVIKDVRPVGKEAKHLKLTLGKNEKFFDAIAFGMGQTQSELKSGEKVDIVYALEDNTWNGNQSLQLKIKDLKGLS